MEPQLRLRHQVVTPPGPLRAGLQERAIHRLDLREAELPKGPMPLPPPVAEMTGRRRFRCDNMNTILISIRIGWNFVKQSHHRPDGRWTFGRID